MVSQLPQYMTCVTATSAARKCSRTASNSGVQSSMYCPFTSSAIAPFLLWTNRPQGRRQYCRLGRGARMSGSPATVFGHGLGGSEDTHVQAEEEAVGAEAGGVGEDLVEEA